MGSIVRRSGLGAGVVVFVLLAASFSVPVGSFGPSGTPSRSVGASTATHSVRSGPTGPPIPLPPTRVHRLPAPGGDSVNPTSQYSKEPAPMGIGDFGVGAAGSSYAYSTSEFLGNFSWTSLNLDNAGQTSFTDQLNVVLQFVQGGTTYAYWIQDVAFMDSSTNLLYFENNIWNFSSSSFCLSSSDVTGNGTVNPISGCEGYYAVYASTSLPGAEITAPSPGDFGLLVRSYRSPTGLPEVAFEYWDGVTSWYVTYDNVVWPWATHVSADNNFRVDGTQYNPTGYLFYDAELTIGGPGGGSQTIAQPSTEITSKLLYWNDHNFEAPPAVWNFGSDTAETVSNLQSFFASDRAGLPLTEQLNGTARNATPALAYDPGRVGRLAISAPGMASGTVAVPGEAWAFVNDSANLTLVPGTYHLWTNSSAGHDDLGECAVVAGSTTYANATSGCTPGVGPPVARPSSVDLGQNVTFRSQLLQGGSGGDSYSWNVSPTSGLGCAASTNLTLSCSPTRTGTYRLNVTVTDSLGSSSTSGTLSFVVYSDPTEGIPTANPSTIETGGTVTFGATPSGGRTPYAFTWTGLPSPCAGTGTAQPTCTPATAGTYSIGVMVEDANGQTAAASGLSYTVTVGPSVSTPSASPAGSIDVGQSVRFSTVAAGGSGGYAYSWSGLPGGCASVSAPTLPCTPKVAGSVTVKVRVVDSAGGAAVSAPLLYRTFGDPELGPMTVLPALVDVGQTVRFNTSVATGGSGNYRYAWSGLPNGCSSANSTDRSCTAASAGSGTATLTVYDSNNGSGGSSGAYRIFSDPSLESLGASPSSIDLSQSVNFSAVGLSGGTGTYAFLWTGLPAGCAATNASRVVCTPKSTGTFLLRLNVTDSAGVSAERSLRFTVYSDPTLSTPVATPVPAVVGESLSLNVTVSGGSGNDSYSWAGLPSGCASVDAPRLTCRPSSPGSASVSVRVTDSNGLVATSGSLQLTVKSATAPTFLGLPAVEGYLVVAGLLGAAAIGAGLFVVLRRRPRREGPPTGPGASGPGSD